MINNKNHFSLFSFSKYMAFPFFVLSGLATGASWLCYFRALQLGEASRVAPVDKLSVVVAIILGLLVLKEPVSLKLLLGGGLIVAGTVVIAAI